MIDPETGLILAIVGGIGTVVTFTLFGVASEAGPKLKATDLLPAPPWEGLPLPRAFYTKPELIREILKRR